MKKRKLTESDLRKYTELSNVPVEILLSLNDLGALDVVAIHISLIKYEYQKLVEETKYTGKQIAEALAEKYGVSRHYVETIVYNKLKDKTYYCIKCGTEMSKYKFSQNKGVCNQCVVSEINQVL